MKPAQLFLAVVAFCLFSITACDDSLVGPDAESDGYIGLEEDVGAEDALAKRRRGARGSAGLRLPFGEAAIVYTFPDVGSLQTPEGIAFDRQGNMYVSNRIGSAAEWTYNGVEKITPDGSHSILADLGGSCPGYSGVLGLTTDPVGNVYAAFSSCTPDHGVVKINRHGSVEHLAGSEAMLFPNSLTFDSRGNLYVTDSFGSAVYRYGKSKSHGKRKTFEVWASSDLLAPNFLDPLPYGANGIAFKAPNHIYVANTTGGWIVHISVLSNGDAGIPEQILPTGPQFYLFLYPDGITIDAHGMLYAAIPPAGTPPPPGVPPPPGGFPPFSPVVKMDPSTGMVTPVVEPFFPGGPGSELFDTQTSLAFGSGPRHRKSVFVISGDLFGTPTGSGPVVTQVGVGAPGAMGQ